MLYQEVTNVSFESFREASAGHKVILLYPWSNHRNLFLSYFLNDAKEGLVYYRVPSEQYNLRSWVTEMAQEFARVLEGFGKAVASLPPKASPTQLAEALMSDFAALQRERIVLYIDELDRVPQDSDFREFMEALVSAMPPHLQLAVNSRMLTYEPWAQMVQKGDAVILGTAHRRNNLMFTVEETPHPQLEVYAFGRGYALTNGQMIENWDGALPRNLFFYFIDNPLLTRDQIFETFWPKLSVKEATNVFHVTKRKITERISHKVEDPENYELTRYSAGFYMPSDKLVRHYDVADFEEAVEHALVMDDEHEREKLYRRAIDIYKGPFLKTINMPWVLKRRAELQAKYAETLIGMGRIYKARNQQEEALGYFTRALKEAPHREDIHREVIAIYINMGRPYDAKEQYRKLEEFLQQTVGIQPSKETRELLKILEM